MQTRLSFFFFFLIGVPLIVIALAMGAMNWQPTPTIQLFARLSLFAEGAVLLLGLLSFAGIALAVRASRTNRARLATVFRTALYATETVAIVLMFLHTIAVFSVVIALFVAVGAALPENNRWTDIGRRIVGPVVVGMLIFAGATVWQILRSMRNANKPLTSNVLGMPLPEAGNEAVWSLVRNTAKQLNALPPENIVVGLDANFFVTEADVHCPEAHLTGRTLFLSLPLCRVMQVDELKAIVAHELAHFKGEDTAYGRKFAQIYRSASEALIVPNMGSSAAYGLVLGGPAYGLLGHFLQAFAVIENAMSRESELIADQSAEQATNSQTYGLALTRAHMAAAWSQHTAERMLSALNQKGPAQYAISNISQLFEEVARSQVEVNEAALIQHTVPHPVDSHPPLVVRLQAQRTEVRAALDDAKRILPREQTAIKLFTDSARLHEIETHLTHIWVTLVKGETIADRLKQASIMERSGQAPADANPLPREIVIRPKGWKLGFGIAAAILVTLFVGGCFALFSYVLLTSNQLNSDWPIFSWVMAGLMVLLFGLLSLYGIWAMGYYLRMWLGRRPLLVLNENGVQSFSEIAEGDVLPWDELDDIQVIKQDAYGMTKALCFLPKDLGAAMKRLPMWKRVLHRFTKRNYPVPHYAGNNLLPMKLEELYGLVAQYHDRYVAAQPATNDSAQAASPVAASPAAGQPAPSVRSDDEGMNAATRQAQSALPLFIGKFKRPQQTQSFFSVRARLGNEAHHEDLWLSELNFDGTTFRGRLDNEPAALRGYKTGDVVDVLAKDVRDWVIVENGRVLGGYTLREQRRRMSAQEQQAFDATMPGPFAAM